MRRSSSLSGKSGHRCAALPTTREHGPHFAGIGRGSRDARRHTRGRQIARRMTELEATASALRASALRPVRLESGFAGTFHFPQSLERSTNMPDDTTETRSGGAVTQVREWAPSSLPPHRNNSRRRRRNWPRTSVSSFGSMSISDRLDVGDFVTHSRELWSVSCVTRDAAGLIVFCELSPRSVALQRPPEVRAASGGVEFQ
jgi:hypothetical protein